VAGSGIPPLGDAPRQRRRAPGRSENLRDEGSTALHLQGVTEATTDAAQLLKGWLDALWNGGEGKRIVYLHVVPGDVARVLVAAGFRERDDWHELIYTMPRSAEASALW